MPYGDLARGFCPHGCSLRHSIEDLSVPSPAEIEVILATVDDSLAMKLPTCVHALGGVGRTGTLIGCWPLRHSLADSANVRQVLMDL